MPKPKLPEEEKKAVMPLRLPKEAIAAVQDLAQIWGERRGKEVKPATVARELVLIGLDVLGVVQHSKMLIDILGQSDGASRMTKIRKTVNQSIPGGISVEEVALAVIKMLRHDRPESLLPSSPVTKHNPTPEDEPIPTQKPDPLAAMEAMQRLTKKGGHE